MSVLLLTLLNFVSYHRERWGKRLKKKDFIAYQKLVILYWYTGV
jgi:hypothetical protein